MPIPLAAPVTTIAPCAGPPVTSVTAQDPSPPATNVTLNLRKRVLGLARTPRGGAEHGERDDRPDVEHLPEALAAHLSPRCVHRIAGRVDDDLKVPKGRDRR